MLLFLVKDAHAVSISVEGISWVGEDFSTIPQNMAKLSQTAWAECNRSLGLLVRSYDPSQQPVVAWWHGRSDFHVWTQHAHRPCPSHGGTPASSSQHLGGRLPDFKTNFGLWILDSERWKLGNRVNKEVEHVRACRVTKSYSLVELLLTIVAHSWVVILHDPSDVSVWGRGGNVVQDANTTGAETNQGGHAMDGHHEINLPAGPLYGRIRIRAWSMFDILPTEYLDGWGFGIGLLNMEESSRITLSLVALFTACSSQPLVVFYKT